MSMNPLARKWIDALRSGEYEQGQNCLRDEFNCFCCLGVAADVLGYDMWVPAGEVYADRFGNPIKGWGLMSSGRVDILPEDFWKQIMGGAHKLLDQTMLAEMNDGGASFIDLANEIETAFDEPPLSEQIEEAY